MNYIGSKYSLLDEIQAVLDDHRVPGSGVAVDLFAGTGSVAQLLKARGHVVFANDWQRYSYVTNVAFLEHNGFPGFSTLLADPHWSRRIRDQEVGSDLWTCSIARRRLLQPRLPCAQVLTYLNELPGATGRFFEAYCEGGNSGRLYFSRENGLRIQAIRNQIVDWSDARLISHKEEAWLLGCLVEGADRVANTASVYGAYLKRLKKTAEKPLALVALEPIPSAHRASQHRVFCLDGNLLLRRLVGKDIKLVYIDPPYNSRQYNANYHVLETLVSWDLDRFSPRGKTGLRPSRDRRSRFCLQGEVAAAVRGLLERICAEYILFSYNNEGLLSKEVLWDLFNATCTDVNVREIDFRRFRADVDRDNRVYKADSTREYLILARRKVPQLSLFSVPGGRTQGALCPVCE
jgi:adenine-specific DNA-methyltransferase